MNIAFLSLSVISFVGLIGIAFCVYLMYRNEKVCQERKRKLKELADKGEEFIKNGDFVSSSHVFDILDRVSYDKMLFDEFWKWPLTKFWEEQ